jgi:polyhydroxyalkanoate synthesis regulator phasin
MTEKSLLASRSAGSGTAAGAWRTYLELASGLGEVSRQKVTRVLKDLVGKGNATAEQLRGLAADLIAANTANREALVRLIKVEVDRALGRVGLATMDEVNELTARVRELERQLRQARAAQEATATEEAPAGARTVAPTPPAGRASGAGAGEPRRRPAKKATTSPAVARATATKTTVKKAVRAKAAKATPAKASATTPTEAGAARPAKATSAKRATPKATKAKATKAAPSSRPTP